jgi:surface polysaccharide O-acyltransferase-like enzyme
MKGSAMNVRHGGQGRLEDHGSRVIQRHFAFDAARAIAALFVIAIHVRGGSIMLALSELGRFAVPIFFAISGYFFKASGFKPLLGRIKNLGALYALWVLLYGILNLWVQSWTPNHPVIDLIFGGGAGYQLWFVSSLIQCMVVCFLLQKAGLSDKAILILACALYVLTSLS